MSSFWDDPDNAAGYLKAGFLGFAGSGKTLTSVLLAAAVRETLGHPGPVAFFDTESGAAYVKDHITTLTGQRPLIKRARSFDDLVAFGKACVDSNVSVAIVDSITHPWRELCDSYLQQKNDARKAAERGPALKKLEFQDWNVIKPRWAQWTDFFINSPLSIIICGRAGWEYEMERDEETGRKELNKVGIKMKTEGEFGFEPSLLVEMELEQTLRAGSVVPDIARHATVLKDRFTVLDGKAVSFASVPFTPEGLQKAYESVKKFFLPHISLLVPGASNRVDTSRQSEFQIDETGEAQMMRERREREILAEEIQAEIVATYPGQSAVEKQAKVEVLKEAFDTGSWTKVESMSAKQLRAGLARLKEALKQRAMPTPMATPRPDPVSVPTTSAPPPSPKPAPARTALDF